MMQQIIVIGILILLAVAGFVLTKKSIDNLKTGILSYYPFSLFIPKSGQWTAVYFIISVGLLFLLLFFLSGVTSLKPA